MISGKWCRKQGKVVYILLPSNTHHLIISKVKQQMDEKVMFLSATLTHEADTGYGEKYR